MLTPSPTRARRDNRGTNGTLTLRRSSTTPFAQSSSQDAPLPTPIETPQQPSTLYENNENARYSKDQLLDMYKTYRESGSTNADVARLLHPEFDPWQVNGTNGRASWGKSTDGRDTYDPTVCWDKQGSNEPILLHRMSEEEKAVCFHSKYALLYFANGY